MLERAWLLAGKPPWSTDERASIGQAIEEAVAAERERCARLAEGGAHISKTNFEPHCPGCETARRIALRIRSEQADENRN